MARNSDVDEGKMQRCYAVRCAICGRTDVYPADNKSRLDGAAKKAENVGWKRTTQLTSNGERMWVCAKHHEPNSYALFVDKETDRREPGEVYEHLPIQ
jgi:hypothetical protein